ncbi:hypothetical protein [Bartonella jaculi]|uniref:hypothetical protein n=1 Tax=Bartonella jaculi TaxID=686226 RepID=UPI0031E691AC
MRQQFVELCCGTHTQSGCYDGIMLLSSIMIWVEPVFKGATAVTVRPSSITSEYLGAADSVQATRTICEARLRESVCHYCVVHATL